MGPGSFFINKKSLPHQYFFTDYIQIMVLPNSSQIYLTSTPRQIYTFFLFLIRIGKNTANTYTHLHPQDSYKSKIRNNIRKRFEKTFFEKTKQINKQTKAQQTSKSTIEGNLSIARHGACSLEWFVSLVRLH